MTEKINVKTKVKTERKGGNQPVNERKLVNKRIEELRTKKLHITQTEFAVLLGMDPKKGRSTVNNWEQGAIQVKSDDLERIARLVPVSADWLLGRSDVWRVNGDLQGIHSATGLSEDAIIKLMQISREKDGSTFPLIISAIIENKNVEFFLSLLSALISLDGASDSIPVEANIDGKTLSLPAESFLKEHIKTLFIEQIHNIAEKYKELER